MAEAISTFTASPEDKIQRLLTATFKTLARERGEDESEIV